MTPSNSHDESIQLFWLLGNPTRFAILRQLGQEPMFLGQLSRELHAHQQALLRHLEELVGRGFLETYEDESIRGPPRKYYRLTKSVRISVHITPDGVRVIRVVPGRHKPRTIQETIQRNYPELVQLLNSVDRLPRIPGELNRKRAAIELIQQLEAKAKETKEIGGFLESVISAIKKDFV